MLAPYIVARQPGILITGYQADATVLGIILTALSVIVMPGLGIAKRRPVIALGIAAWSIWEGVEAWREHDCC